MSNSSTTMKMPNIISDLITYPFFIKEESFSSAKYVSELREEVGGRYRKEIGDALDKLLRKPKKKWPKLLRH